MPSNITTWRQIIVYLTVLAMVLLARPEPMTFAIGCAIAAAGIAIRIWGCGHLRKNVEMISSGPFAHVQHPLYLGTFLVALGAMLAAGSPRMPALLIWTVIAPAFVLAFFGFYLPKKRRVEGERLAKRFGAAFSEWHAAVPPFVPSLSAYPNADGRRWSWRVFRGNHELEMDVLIAVLFCAVFFAPMVMA